MLQAEVLVDLDAIRGNVAALKDGTTAQVMAVVKGDGYGHGMVPAARAALAGGATWLGVCTVDEALGLRHAGLTAPVLAWLWGPHQPLEPALNNDIDLSVASLSQLAAVVAAAKATGRVAHTHLKVDTGLARNGATIGDWPLLVEAAAKAQADGTVEIVGAWSHFVYADAPGHETIGRQLAVFQEGLQIADQHGVRPQLRHIANSAGLLTLSDAHFDLVRPGLAIYGLSPIAGERYGLRPAMTAHGQVLLAKNVPAGTGVSYGHTYHTEQSANLALVPFGYADGVPRHTSSKAPVSINGERYRISGRVCMDQFIVDMGSAEVHEGDKVVLFGPGDNGEPTADDWAVAADTINYEIVTRFGSSRIPRNYVGNA